MTVKWNKGFGINGSKDGSVIYKLNKLYTQNKMDKNQTARKDMSSSYA